jgi:hypothetical protein
MRCVRSNDLGFPQPPPNTTKRASAVNRVHEILRVACAEDAEDEHAEDDDAAPPSMSISEDMTAGAARKDL